MRNRFWPTCLVLSFLLFAPFTGVAQETPSWAWYTVNNRGEVTVNLYLFHRKPCPHCDKAIAYFEAMKKRKPYIKVNYLDSSNPANSELCHKMAKSLNREATRVPAIFYCKHLDIGYASDERTGARIEDNLARWHGELTDHFRKSKQKR